VRILVTGAGGFVGNHLLRALRAEGAVEIFATTLVDGGETRPSDIEGVEWVPLDVTSMDSVVETVARTRPDAVYHLAGQASVGASFESPLVTWDVNASGTLRLLVALQKHSPDTRRVVLASSAEVYGIVAAENQPISESSPLDPVNPYGASKVAAEAAAIGASRAGGIDVVIARTFNLIGPGQDGRFVVPSIARQLSAFLRQADGDRVLQLGNLSVERDFLDIRDAVAAYILLMQRGQSGTAYNICSGTSRPLSAIVERLVELSGSNAKVVVDPSRVRPTDIPVLVGRNDRLRGLGWEPGHRLDETLQAILDDARRRI
jgi:GDP-4-dehydro-6-deoxy-D-mannose reductase